MKPITEDTRAALVQWLDNQDAWSIGRLLIIHDRTWWQGDRGDFRRPSYWLDRMDDSGAHGLALGPLALWWEPKDGGWDPMNADHKLLGTDLDKIAPAADTGRPSSNDYRRAARRLHEREGVIEIEEFAHIEDADDRPGVWVEAWVFVSDEDARTEDAQAQGEN